MIVLKNIDKAEPEEIRVLANNPLIAANLRDAFPYPYTVENAVVFLELVKSGALGHVFGIYEGNTFVGACSVIPGQDVHRINGEIGYWVGEPYWGKGYATEAVKRLTAFAFDELKLLRLYASIFDYNKASMRGLEKAGFALEAVIKSSVIKNGQIWGEHLFSVRKG